MTSDEEDYAPYSLYFEVFGPGLLYSLSFDYRFVENAAFRFGAGYFEFGIFSPSHEFVTVPLTLSYLPGSGNHFFEIGAGATLIFETTPSTGDTELQPAPVALLGYRYQRTNGGFMFRIGVNVFALPDDDEWEALPWPYLSLGATF